MKRKNRQIFNLIYSRKKERQRERESGGERERAWQRESATRAKLTTRHHKSLIVVGRCRRKLSLSAQRGGGRYESIEQEAHKVTHNNTQTHTHTNTETHTHRGRDTQTQKQTHQYTLKKQQQQQTGESPQKTKLNNTNIRSGSSRGGSSDSS